MTSRPGSRTISSPGSGPRSPRRSASTSSAATRAGGAARQRPRRAARDLGEPRLHAQASFFDGLHVSIGAKTAAEVVEPRPAPEWALGFPGHSRGMWLWAGDVVRAAVGDPPKIRYPSASPEVEPLVEAVGRCPGRGNDRAPRRGAYRRGGAVRSLRGLSPARRRQSRGRRPGRARPRRRARRLAWRPRRPARARSGRRRADLAAAAPLARDNSRCCASRRRESSAAGARPCARRRRARAPPGLRLSRADRTRCYLKSRERTGPKSSSSRGVWSRRSARESSPHRSGGC